MMDKDFSLLQTASLCRHARTVGLQLLRTFRIRQFFAAAAILTATCLAFEPVQARAAGFPALAALSTGGPRVSALAVDLSDGRVLAELDAGTRLTPASLTKLSVAGATLDHWPADHTFQTRLLAAGEVESGTLVGDLVLQGGGDPSLEAATLWSLAAQVRGAGIAAIHGRLVVNVAPFGVVGCETRDRCDALQRSDRSYNAPVAAAGVDYGTWCISVRPGSPGRSAQVRGCQVSLLPIEVDGSIRTVGHGGRTTFRAERVTIAGTDVLRVGGDIAAGDPQELYRAMSDPAHGTGLLLREMLREIGVTVSGEVVVSTEVPVRTSLLAHTDGLMLSELLDRMLRYSNNYIADVLTLDLAADTQSMPPATLAAAGGVLSDFVGAALAGAGHPRGCISDTPPLLHSGSGLTPENLLSACDLVSVLARQYRDTRHFPVFYGGLVVPRDAPFAFLRQGGAAWLDRVALKTGSMDDPHSVLGVAGYLRKKDGGFIAVAAIVNGGGARLHVPLGSSMEAVRADIESLLERY